MPYYPNYYQQQQNYQQGTQSIVWVSGEAGAKAYIVAPNSTVALFDSEAPVVYLKSCDASGMPSIKTLDYTIRDNAPNTSKLSPTSDYLTKDDILSIEERINALEGKLERYTHKKKNNHNKGGLNNE